VTLAAQPMRMIMRDGSSDSSGPNARCAGPLRSSVHAIVRHPPPTCVQTAPRRACIDRRAAAAG
jgi:hypothetical protein